MGQTSKRKRNKKNQQVKYEHEYLFGCLYYQFRYCDSITKKLGTTVFIQPHN